MLCAHRYMSLCAHCSWQQCGFIVSPRYVRWLAPRRSQSSLSAHQELSQVYYSCLKGSLTIVPCSTVPMTDEAGPSTQDRDPVASGITIREGLREALRQILREEPSLLQATTRPFNPHFSRYTIAAGTLETRQRQLWWTTLVVRCVRAAIGQVDCGC